MNNLTNEFDTKNIFTCIVGKPNVGKSSILNKLIGEKVAIVTSKPQTTRTKITGVITKENLQYIFLDTPGIHTAKTKLGNRMVKAVGASIADVDAALMLFEPYGELTEAEMKLVEDIKQKKLPAVAVINKTDTLKKQTDLLLRIEFIKNLDAFTDILTTSVIEEKGIDDVFTTLEKYAVNGPHYFPADAYTDIPEKVIVSEIIREKMLLNLHDEIPHGIAITIEKFKERAEKQIIDIDVNIYCEKKSHKGMVIGKGGQMLKKIASQARVDCEQFLDTKVNLQCWVKIKDDWRDNEFLLNNFGFEK